MSDESQWAAGLAQVGHPSKVAEAARELPARLGLLLRAMEAVDAGSAHELDAVRQSCIAAGAEDVALVLEILCADPRQLDPTGVRKRAAKLSRGEGLPIADLLRVWAARRALQGNHGYKPKKLKAWAAAHPVADAALDALSSQQRARRSLELHDTLHTHPRVAALHALARSLQITGHATQEWLDGLFPARPLRLAPERWDQPEGPDAAVRAWIVSGGAFPQLGDDDVDRIETMAARPRRLLLGGILRRAHAELLADRSGTLGDCLFLASRLAMGEDARALARRLTEIAIHLRVFDPRALDDGEAIARLWTQRAHHTLPERDAIAERLAPAEWDGSDEARIFLAARASDDDAVFRLSLDTDVSQAATDALIHEANASPRRAALIRLFRTLGGSGSSRIPRLLEEVARLTPDSGWCALAHITARWGTPPVDRLSPEALRRSLAFLVSEAEPADPRLGYLAAALIRSEGLARHFGAELRAHQRAMGAGSAEHLAAGLALAHALGSGLVDARRALARQLRRRDRAGACLALATGATWTAMTGDQGDEATLRALDGYLQQIPEDHLHSALASFTGSAPVRRGFLRLLLRLDGALLTAAADTPAFHLALHEACPDEVDDEFDPHAPWVRGLRARPPRLWPDLMDAVAADLHMGPEGLFEALARMHDMFNDGDLPL